jgi:hypothetical protein
MPHLDDDLYRLIGERPRDVPGEVCAHLRKDCPECTAFLERLPANQLDGRIDRLLREPEPAALPSFRLTPGEGNAKLVRGLLTALAGLTVLSLFGAYAVWSSTRGPRQIMASAPGISLKVAVTHPDGSKTPAATTTLDRHDVLTPEIELQRGGYVSLVRYGENAGFDFLLLNDQLGAGKHVLESEGKPLVVALDALSGHQRLAAVSCDRPMVKDEALSAARGLNPPGIGMGVFDFVVR